MNVESVSKPTFLNNREILKKRQADKEEEEKNAPIFGTWGTILMQINEVSVEVEEGTLTSLLASNKAISLFSVSELNSLPIFANEIRNQIGYAIRGLSISSWNKQEDIISALKLIKIALQINVSADVKETLIQDETELFKLQEKYKGIITCYFCDKQKVEERSKLTKTIYKENSRSYFPRRSVQYSYADIEIPRCGSCAKIHSAGNDNYLFVLFAGLILGGIIGAFIDEHFIVGGLIGAFVGWIIGKILESNLASKNGIKDISNSTLRNHPKLLERIQNGWTFSKPTA